MTAITLILNPDISKRLDKYLDSKYGVSKGMRATYLKELLINDLNKNG